MAKYTFTVFTLLLLAMITVYYHMQQWKVKQRMLLEQLSHIVQNDYKEKSIMITESVRKDIVRIVKHQMVQSMKDELNQEFLPDQRQDNQLKLGFKYAIRDEIQKDFTKTIRTLLKEDIKGIAKEVIANKAFDKEAKTYPQNLCSKNKKLLPHQKVLVYTVFGTRKLYYEGIPIMLREAVASNLYHDWHIRIYHDALITPEVIAKYKEYKNLDFCDARYIPRYGDLTNILGKFWRNVPIADDSVDVMCSRDLDSSLLTREEDAVKDFLQSDKLLHTMRDFTQHQVGILAGMWCLRPMINRTMARNLLEILLNEAKTYKLRTDQPLLNKVIWNNIDKQKYAMQHGSFHCKFYEGTIPFPTQRKDNMEFVGCPGHVCSWKNMTKCPKECRPKNHQDWEYC